MLCVARLLAHSLREEFRGDRNYQEVGMEIKVNPVLFVLLFCRVAARSLEPQCSSFHYEEQLLAKLVRMEHEFELLEKHTAGMLEKMESQLDLVKARNEALTKELAGKLDQITGDNTLTIWFNANTFTDLILAKDKTLVFTTTVADDYNTYNNKTGEFTAPKDGLYLFSTQICFDPNKYVRFDIFVAGNPVSATISNDDKYTTCVTSTAFGRMREGEKCVVQSTYAAGSALTDNRFYKNSFSGVFLSK